MYIPEGVHDGPIHQREKVEPSSEEQHVFTFARYVAITVMAPYMSAMVYTMRPCFVEGYGLQVDSEARLYVGIESLRQFDDSREMSRRLGQKIIDAGYMLLMDMHPRVSSMDDVDKAAVAAEIEATRAHTQEVTKSAHRADDTVFVYAEQFEEDIGHDALSTLRAKGIAMEELYNLLPSRQSQHETVLSMSGADGGDDSEKAPGRTPDQIDAARESVAAEMIAMGVGSVAGDMMRWAEKRKQPIVVPWHVVLKRTFSRAAADKPGSSFETYDDRAEEQVGVDIYYARMRGTSIANSMGVPRLSAAKGHKTTFDIYVDTSGSMTERDLGTVLGQVEPIFRRHQSRVRVWAGDVEVQGLGAAGSLQEVASMLKGGGGTSFVPAFNMWASMPRNKRPRSVMFFTDGYGPAPAKPPPGMKVYWVLVGATRRTPYVEGSRGKDVSYGTIIEVPNIAS